MFFRGCVNIVAQSFSQLRRTKTADVSRILSALGAPSTTRTDLQASTSLPLLISAHYFVIVIQAHCSLPRTVWGLNHARNKLLSFFFPFCIITLASKVSVVDLAHPLICASFCHSVYLMFRAKDDGNQWWNDRARVLHENMLLTNYYHPVSSSASALRSKTENEPPQWQKTEIKSHHMHESLLITQELYFTI